MLLVCSRLPLELTAYAVNYIPSTLQKHQKELMASAGLQTAGICGFKVFSDCCSNEPVAMGQGFLAEGLMNMMMMMMY